MEVYGHKPLAAFLEGTGIDPSVFSEVFYHIHKDTLETLVHFSKGILVRIRKEKNTGVVIMETGTPDLFLIRARSQPVEGTWEIKFLSQFRSEQSYITPESLWILLESLNLEIVTFTDFNLTLHGVQYGKISLPWKFIHYGQAINSITTLNRDSTEDLHRIPVSDPVKFQIHNATKSLSPDNKTDDHLSQLLMDFWLTNRSDILYYHLLLLEQLGIKFTYDFDPNYLLSLLLL